MNLEVRVAGNDVIEIEGVIKETKPNANFIVELENGARIQAAEWSR